MIHVYLAIYNMINGATGPLVSMAIWPAFSRAFSYYDLVLLKIVSLLEMLERRLCIDLGIRLVIIFSGGWSLHGHIGVCCQV